jgi:sortase (surface protein transpeptidase)
MASHASNISRSRWRSRTWRYVAIAATIIGVVLIAVTAVYAYWQIRSGSDADQFNVAIPQDDRDVLTGVNAAPPAPVSQQSVTAYASLYPGGRINPRYWSNPEWAGSIPFGAPGIPDGFSPVSSRDPIAAEAAGAQATRIRIPSIGLDSHIAALELLDLGDQRAYQTPDNTVGYIPETSDPGELNNGWYFGHLESFGTGEGSVFNSLPEVAELIRHDPVDIFVETDDAEYMYRVTSTSQIHQDDLQLTQSDSSQITLCTCWPPRVYDRRVLVNAELIAVKRG